MTIYSYYYGASSGGIGIQSIAKQLEGLGIRSDLKELASLHALTSPDRPGEMLSYLLRRDGYSILGLSYTESPQNSGYGRSAPCGLELIVPEADMDKASAELGTIVNFVSFQKPNSASPSPLTAFPLNESGYSFHNSPAILTPLVENLVRVTLSEKKEVLLVALPKGKSNEYATARYTIAEALNCLPVALRKKVRFFTGLPVGEGASDPLAGYDTAVNTYGANVVFCSNEFYERLKSYRSFIGLNMDRPSGTAGAYAEYIAQTVNPSFRLHMIDSYLGQDLTYESLNRAAVLAQSGKQRTMEDLKTELAEKKNECDDLKAQNADLNQQVAAIKRENNSLINRWKNLEQQDKQYQQELAYLRNENRELKSQPKNNQVKDYRYVNEETISKKNRSAKKNSANIPILYIVITVILAALVGAACWIVSAHVYSKSALSSKEADKAVVTPVVDGITDAETETSPTTTPEPSDDASDPQGENAGDVDNSSVVDSTMPPENDTEDEGQDGPEEPEQGLSDSENEEDQVDAAETSEGDGSKESQASQEEQSSGEMESDTTTADPQAEGTESSDVEDMGSADHQEDDADTEQGLSNQYGEVNGDDVILRAGKGTETDRITTLQKGTRVRLVSVAANGTEREEWTEVETEDGQRGFIKSDYLTILPGEDSASSESLQPAPAPSQMFELLPTDRTE